MNNLLDLIKELRAKTGAGFLDCKLALKESENSLEKAIEYLRKKGLAKATKKSSREANEGGVGIYSNDIKIIVLKLNSETDFAAKSETFLNFMDELGEAALSSSNEDLDLEKFMKINYNGSLISEHLKNMIAKIGENILITELICFNKKNQNFAYYVHNNYKKNIGKIISIISYQSSKIDQKIEELSKNLCMHIAAMKPESIDIPDLDINIIDKEKKIQKELIASSGKPSNIIDKILEGKMNKFYSEVTLLNQTYILDQDKTVKTCIKDYESKFNFKIQSFEIISL